MHNFTLVNESGSLSVPSDQQFYQWFCAAVGNDFTQSEVDLLLVTATRMSEINLLSRGKTGPTNTLAFPFTPQDNNMPLFGEIVMCPEVIELEAQKKRITPIDHWAHLTIHSTLHLMGFDHECEKDADLMEQREIATLAQFGIANPY